MATFSDVIIIYNPHSTGPSEKNAKAFAEQLERELPWMPRIKVIATTHAGHGRSIAKEYATRIPKCLIVSSSGDGGYHDVINGVLESGSKTATTGLLPSGNANDHYHALHSGDTIKRIATGETSLIDVLLIEGTSKQKKFHEYAHSYAGIGLTPHIGNELNKTKLNSFKEIWLTLVNLIRMRSVRIDIDGKTKKYESLVFSTIPRMAKTLNLSDNAVLTDGKFEINSVPKVSFFHLLLHLVRASTLGLKEDLQTNHFSFTCHGRLLIQLDGEVSQLDSGSTCTITILSKKLRCII